MRDIAEQLGSRRLTPMLRQYVEAKKQAPADALLMFRMGDFYELFFDDAELAAEVLDLTLTSRDKDSDTPVPMAGVPHHAADAYVVRLVERGYAVALCDQVEDPKDAKGIVKREIVRLVTPGTVSDLEALDPATTNHLACAVRGEAGVVVALLDLLAGETSVTWCRGDELGDELRRMAVRELLISNEDREALDLGRCGVAVRTVEHLASEPDARAQLKDRAMDVLPAALPGGVQGLAWRALAALVAFAETTQRRRLTHFLPPRAYRRQDSVHLDNTTRTNLELLETTRGKREGSLVWHLDRCATAMGSRLLRQWMVFPLREPERIAARLDAVAGLLAARGSCDALRRGLAQVRDIERLLGRVNVGVAHPRDLAMLRTSLAGLPELRALLGAQTTPLGQRWAKLDLCEDVYAQLARALVDDPGVTTTDGGIFARGYRGDLDELIALSSDGHAYLADLERRERERTGIASLKVRFNKVFGYYLEVSRANLERVPNDYVRKQTLVGGERFITEELKAYETRVLSADGRRSALEHELFVALVEAVARQTARLRRISRLIAETDVLLSLATVADEGRYVRPEVVPEPTLELRASRHPVLERLMPGGEPFVPNDVSLDARSRQILIVTGPNMAGKSTVMRQVAISALLAHMGSFVPAQSARIGLCDRIFTRVGASDDLGGGHSTFMVEMLETAAILKHATQQSLVVLDEIGRGTSTFDGISIAWAVAESLHDVIGCRAMFATHYHELTDLALTRPRVVNVSTAVQEERGRIVFLRRLVDGAAARSYGIHVARLAGLPREVLERARQILENLERGELDAAGMPTVARRGDDATARGPSAVEKMIADVDIEQTTPLQALVLIESLKSAMNRSL